MRVIAVSGGIATGKSTVRGMLSESGVACLDMDEIGRELLLPGGWCYGSVVEHFGDGILEDKGVGSERAIDRTKLTERIFSNPAERRALGAIMNMPVTLMLLWRLFVLCLWRCSLVAVEMPLLFEFGLNRFIYSVVISVPQELQLERLMQRNNITEEDAKRRIAAQMPLHRKVSLADFVLDNSGTLKEMRAQIQKLRQTVYQSTSWKTFSVEMIIWITVFVLISLCAGLYVVCWLVHRALASL